MQMNPLLDTAGLALYDQLLKAVAGGSLELKDGKLVLKSVDGTILGETDGIVCSVNGVKANADGSVLITSVENATKASKDADGNVISSTYLKSATASSTYLTKTDAASTYLGKTAKAASATTADSATTATSATKATQDGEGNVITQTYLKSEDASDTYLSKTDATSTYLGKTAKAASATVADSATTAASATKATQDGDGNVIDETYATKDELTDGLGGKANSSHTHSIGNITNLQSTLDGKLGVSANAESASKWATARTITLSGDASGSVSIDGSENKTLTVTVADDSHNHIISNVDGLQSALDGKASTSSVETALATAKSYTDTAVANLVDSAPETLNTIGEVAAALQANEDVTDALNEAIGSKANASEVVKLSGNQTIAGTKTFSSTISGSINGNAASATKATQDGSGNVITSTYLTKSDASSTYLGKTAKAASATVADSANAVAWANVSGKPDSYTPASHNQASSTITALTGYAKASSASALSTSDSLNGALGKLEKALDGKLSTSGTAAKATADADGNTISSTYLKKTDASSTYLGKTAKAASATVADSANAVAWTNVSDKPTAFAPASHTQASSTIDALTGYSKPSSTAALATTDTLNSALGKLEKALDGKLFTTGTAAKATADASGNVITSTYLTKTDASSTYMTKASITSGTTDLTAGTSNLATGSIYLVYE